MISQKKLEANRRNAQKSTGPRTAEGKARSARNATTHGLFAADNVIYTMGETDAEYLTFKNTLLDAFPTEHPIDRVLAEDFINCHWRLRRVRHMEAGYLDSMCQELLENAREFKPAPDYSNTEAQPRAGDFRLIGNAGSLGNLYLNNLSRYESRLRSASYRALAEIGASKFEPTAEETVAGKIEPTLSQPEENAPEPAEKIEPTGATLSTLLNNLLPIFLFILALLSAAPATATAPAGSRNLPPPVRLRASRHVSAAIVSLPNAPRPRASLKLGPILGVGPFPGVSSMNLIALVGGETLLGADVREALVDRVPDASIRLIGSHDETILTAGQGEAVVMTGLDAAAIAEARAVVLAGTRESSLKAFSILERSAQRPVIVDLTAALEDRPEARLRAPSVEGGAPGVPSTIQIVAHPAAIILAKVLRAAKGAGRAVATILAPASERGRAGVEELRMQTVQLFSFQPLQQEVFGAQLSFNLLAGASGQDERTIERHLASLLSTGPPAPMPSIRVIQTPVMHGYSISLWVEGAGDFDREGLDLWVDAVPSPVGVAGENGISIGSMERDRNHGSAIWMWIAADQFRVAARNAADLVKESL